MEGSWRVLGDLGGILEICFGRSWRYFSERSGDVWRDLGGILEGLGRSWRDLGGSWEILEGSWRDLGHLSWQILGGWSWDSCAARGAAEAPCPVLARLGGAGRRPRRGVAFGAVLEPVLDDGSVCLRYFMSSVENAPRLGVVCVWLWGWGPHTMVARQMSFRSVACVCVGRCGRVWGAHPHTQTRNEASPAGS